MRKLLILPFLLFTFFQVLAQTHPCGFTDIMNDRYEEEPSLLEMREVYEAEIQQIINARSSFSEKTIPVVIHVIYNDSYSNISSSQVASAITAINEDFNADNSDYSSVISAFSGVKSNLNINFELARLDPNGNTTSGITRTQSDLTDSAGENVKALVNWDSNMYLNIWVVDNIESGAGAYAYYPGTAPSGNEGIVCRHNQFGTWGTSSSSNFAATTLTHEIGHYLNLAHTWGNSNDPELESNCNEDDGVSDTPNTKGTLYDCNTNQSTCGSLDNVQNYMDYTDCTNMFTTGQRSRAHAALHSSQGGRVNLWQYENLIATGLVEDTSCQTELITVQIQTGSYASEVSWVILDQGGEGVAGGGVTYSNYSDYNISVCLEQGSYTFQSIDSYGDGWNGGNYYVRNCDNVIIANNSDPAGYGTTESFIVSFCGTILGCTNVEASNYNPEAEQDDGSCIILGCTDTGALNYNVEATTEDNTCQYLQVPNVFDYELTGINHTICLPLNIDFNILDIAIENLDIIGVFYDDENGIEHCAGYGIWQGIINTFLAQGDDPATVEIDGYQEGETFKVKVWDQSENLYYYCIVHYTASMPNHGEYSTNGISEISAGTAIQPVTSQQIDLVSGWSIFSTYMVSENMNVTEVMSPIYESLVIVKDFQGLAYIAAWDFNAIGDFTYGAGYRIKTNQATTLEVSGVYNDPEEAQITLPIGWGMFGYLRTEPANCIAVLQTINSEIEIVKNSSGTAYLPSWGFNGIGNLNPAEGYRIKMNSSQILEYKSNLEEY